MHFEVLAVFLGDTLQRDQPITAHDLGGVGFFAIDDDAQQLHRNAQTRIEPNQFRTAVDRVRQRADLPVERVHDGVDVDLLSRQSRRSAHDDAQNDREGNCPGSGHGMSPPVSESGPLRTPPAKRVSSTSTPGPRRYPSLTDSIPSSLSAAARLI